MENKHTRGELAQLQSLPLSAKILRSKALIRAWYEHFDGDVHVSFSGWKDSTVLKHLVDGIYSDVPSVFVNTGLEYPEIQRFVRQCRDGMFECCGLNSNVEIVYPERKFTDVIRDVGYPVISKEVAQVIYEGRRGADRLDGSYIYRLHRLHDTGPYEVPEGGKKSQFSASRYNFLLKAPFPVSSLCCNYMKKEPMKKLEKERGSRPFIGTMADESAARKQQWIRHGCNSFDKSRMSSNPMAFWRERDVLEYISDYGLPMAEVYGGVDWVDGEPKLTGVNRTGCMFCLFGIHREPNPNRLERMKVTHPKQYDFCMKPVSEGGLGLKDIIDWINENGNLRKKILY